jgi:type VI secretion system protein ImpB
VEIDRDNFGDVLAKVAPKLTGIDGALDAEGQDADGLTFRSMDDFNPAALVQRVKSLKQLQDQRSALRDLLTKLDSNDALYRAVKERVQGKTMKALGDAAATQLAQLQAPAGEPADKEQKK